MYNSYYLNVHVLIFLYTFFFCVTELINLIDICNLKKNYKSIAILKIFEFTSGTLRLSQLIHVRILLVLF